MEKLTRSQLGILINELRIKSDMAYANLVEKAIAVNDCFDTPMAEIAVRRNFTPEGLATIFLVHEGIDFEMESKAQAVANLNEAYGEYIDVMGKVSMLCCLRDTYYFD